MITLKHMNVEHFRILRDIDLHFPQRGSVLLQGPNEAGKTALLEGLYFALYGFPLHTPAHTLDDLIHYNTPRASVTLTLSIATTELTITRTIERAKGQNVILRVQRLGLPGEPPITDLEQANERIITELGYLDGETMRDSYMIEQRELGKLEQLKLAERTSISGKLLGLEKLRRFTEQFQVTPDDETRLADLALRLQLAEMQERIPLVSGQLGELDAALDALSIVEALEEITLQKADIEEQEQTITQVLEQRVVLKTRQGRIQLLRKADTVLGEIIATYDALAEAQRELPELERQVAELDLRERDELPDLEKRVRDLVELTRSFGTLERLSNDLLAAINSAKELERDAAVYQELRKENDELDRQIAAAETRVEQVRQARSELEEQRRVRPQLAARLSRLKKLRQRLSALRQLEEQHIERGKEQAKAEANSEELEKARKEVREAEQELVLVEAEAQQNQKRADEIEKRWQQLNIRRQLADWSRLRKLADSLSQAEQHVVAAHQRQNRLSAEFDAARQKAVQWLIMIIGAAAGAVVLIALALLLFVALHQPLVSLLLGILALVALAAGGLCLRNYSTISKKKAAAEQRVRDGSNEVSMMVAARETARRMLGDSNALSQIEREIQLLGGAIPRSVEEAERMMRQIPENGENIAEVQQQVTAKRASATASRGQVNATMDTVASLRKERARLEEQRKAAGWDDIENMLRADKIAIEDMQHEIAGLSGQEGLPIPMFDDAAPSISSTTSLEQAVTEAIATAEREIAALDSKLGTAEDLSQQWQTSQDALDQLLEKQRALHERGQHLLSDDPVQKLAKARTHQAALSSALQSLQDSLRLHVRALGVSFGQAAINSAEVAARRQLEALHVQLDSRVELQKRREQLLNVLKESQDTLAEQYHRLAKFSGTLGSWVVPANPFAETLTGLRTRCQREIVEADERGITRAFETLRQQENACNAKITLCQQEIEDTQEHIAALLAQHHRPASASYRGADVISVWPLVGQFALKDRERLMEEQAACEQELHRLEEQEIDLSSRLRVERIKLDPAEIREQLALHKRLYAAKKRAGLLLNGLTDRLMHKMQPRIEYFLQQLVPLLTSGRYHDVHLEGWLEEAGEQSDTGLRLRVWDSVAGAYVNKSALSTGAADQLSLALRLAFAIASLPRELRAAPGFLVLDEPLSSFDRARAQALASMIVGETLGQHFEQILFFSQSSAFEPSMFPYHITLDGGSIIDHNLPSPPPAPVTPLAPGDNETQTGASLLPASLSSPVTLSAAKGL